MIDPKHALLAPRFFQLQGLVRRGMLDSDLGLSWRPWRGRGMQGINGATYGVQSMNDGI